MHRMFLAVICMGTKQNALLDPMRQAADLSVREGVGRRGRWLFMGSPLTRGPVM